MTSIIDDIHAHAARHVRTVALPEATDERVLRAAVEVKSRGIANPVLLGSTDEIREKAKSSKLELGDIVCLDPQVLKSSDELIDHLASCRRYRRWSRAGLSEALTKPLMAACCLLATGQVDACVAGAISDSAEVIRHGQRVVGMHAGSNGLLSSFFLMVYASPPVTGMDFALFADCAINVSPNCEQLAQIAVTTAASAAQLFELNPHLALLSFSSDGSARHIEAARVRCAVSQIREQYPALRVIGEIQFDAALLPSLRETKMPGAAYARPANVYIFPDLNSGNIAYKVAERIGGAKAIGPILQGLNKPLNDVSRGADVEAIVNTIALSCLQVD